MKLLAAKVEQKSHTAVELKACNVITLHARDLFKGQQMA